MPTLIVGSTNPVKMKCFELGLQQMFPDLAYTVEGVKAESGVPDQPMGHEETIRGARNRALRARELKPEADLFAGVEGGIITDEHNRLVAVAWVVIIDKNGRDSQASTGTFLLPPQLAADVKAGLEMGLAAEKLHGTTNVKQGLGTVGILTQGVMDRTAYYVHAVILALIPFKNPTLYTHED